MINLANNRLSNNTVSNDVFSRNISIEVVSLSRFVRFFVNRSRPGIVNPILLRLLFDFIASKNNHFSTPKVANFLPMMMMMMVYWD